MLQMFFNVVATLLFSGWAFLSFQALNATPEEYDVEHSEFDDGLDFQADRFISYVALVISGSLSITGLVLLMNIFITRSIQ